MPRRCRLIARGILAGILSITLAGCAQPQPEQSSTSAQSPTPADIDVNLPFPSATRDLGSSPDREISTSSARPAGFGQGLGSYRAYFSQTINWSACGEDECGWFWAPLDWHDPAGDAITIALKRRPASQDRLGALFVNPGGPGGSAQDFVDSVDIEGLEGFDIIGMDSRGSGESTPVVCGTDAQTDAILAVDSSPDDPSEVDALNQASREFAMQCREHSGALLDHISSIETIWDYELARNLLGEAKLNFYGVSYGSYLAALYLALYPDNAGRIIADSVVDLRPETTESLQVEGFELNLRTYAQWCAENSCGLGSSEDEVIATIRGFLDRLDADPLVTDSGRVLTQTLALTGMLLFFYFDESYYPNLTSFLLVAMDGDGQYLLAAADQVNERGDDGVYDSLVYSFPAIACADEADLGLDASYESWRTLSISRAPVLGWYMGPSTNCEVWTARATVTPDFSALPTPEFLILQNTGDSATPARNAEIMKQEMPAGVLVTREAVGHGALDDSPCLTQIVVDYLVDGILPEDGTVCPN